MMLLPCPWCGPRNEGEFHNGGDANKRRAINPETLTDEAWCEYLYVPANTKGWLREYWWHFAGCGRWFTLNRNTFTHALRADPSSDHDA
jgi:heterotetrameric sarcosine oxidase delta subunit